MDAELLGYVRQKVCEENALDVEHASRLVGRSVGELRDDARRLRRQLGLDPEPARGSDGRYASSHEKLNQEIRRAAGR